MGYFILFMWVSTAALQIVFAVRGFRAGEAQLAAGKWSIWTLAAGSICPFFTLVLFLRVYVLGGSSHVAQFAATEGLNLWSLWFLAWPMMFFGNPPSVLLCLAALAFPPYPPESRHLFASRLCGIATAGFAVWIVFLCVPDA